MKKSRERGRGRAGKEREVKRRMGGFIGRKERPD